MSARSLLGPALVFVICWFHRTLSSWNVTSDVTLGALYVQLILFTFAYVVGVQTYRNDQGTRSFWVLVCCIFLGRAILVFTPVQLTGDIPRYLWEGMLVRKQINPFLYAPNAAELIPMRTEYWANIEYSHLSAIYPPVAQYFMAALAKTLTTWKLALFFVELASFSLLLTLLRLRNLPVGRVVYYLLLPVSFIEIAASGHLEGLVVFFFLLFLYLAEQRKKVDSKKFALWLLGFAAALGLLSKYVLIVPFGLYALMECRRGNLKQIFMLSLYGALFVLLFFLPFLWPDPFAPFRSLQTYVAHWRYNDSLLHLLGWMSGVDFEKLETFSHLKTILLGVWATFTLYLGFRESDFLRASILSFCLFFLCSAVVHPWYVLWFAPMLCFVPLGAGVWLAAAVPFAYLSLSTGEVPTAIKMLEYGPVFILLVFALRQSAKGQGRFKGSGTPKASLSSVNESS